MKSGKGSKGTTNTIPPKRGQIKARIFEEIVVAAAGAVGGKCGGSSVEKPGSSSTVYSYTSDWEIH